MIPMFHVLRVESLITHKKEGTSGDTAPTHHILDQRSFRSLQYVSPRPTSGPSRSHHNRDLRAHNPASGHPQAPTPSNLRPFPAQPHQTQSFPNKRAEGPRCLELQSLVQVLDFSGSGLAPGNFRPSNASSKPYTL